MEDEKEQTEIDDRDEVLNDLEFWEDFNEAYIMAQADNFC